LGGAVGDAAKAVADLLHPHFVKEEAYALPPLGLLVPLANGEVGPEMAEVLAMTDQLRSELPNMLAEHARIVEALGRLTDAAVREATDRSRSSRRSGSSMPKPKSRSFIRPRSSSATTCG
jgi:hypothetical protein